MQVWLRFLSGGRRGETVPLNIPPGGSATIGRADDNALVLPPAVDVAASSYHAELKIEGTSLVLYDTKSTNGTWVYGNRISSVPLASGVRVTFGRGGPEAEVFFQPDPVPSPSPGVAMMPLPPQPAAGQRQAAGSPTGTAPLRAAAPPSLGTPEGKPSPTGTAPLRAAAPPVLGQSAPQAPNVLPRPGDPCGHCGTTLADDMFMCYGCRLGLCAHHYDPAAGTCVVCSGAQAASSNATRPQKPVPMEFAGGPAAGMPAMGATAPHRQALGAPAPVAAFGAQPPAEVHDGCDICGAVAVTSFVCYACTRSLCESHRDPASNMCEQCAGVPAPQPGGGYGAPGTGAWGAGPTAGGGSKKTSIRGSSADSGRQRPPGRRA